MASILRTKEGTWRAQVRRKGKYTSQTFRLKTLASEWVAETERLIDIGCEPTFRKAGKPRTVADLIDLHIADLLEVGKLIRRSKRAVLVALKRDLGATRISHLNRFALIKYGKMRAKQGAGPVTLSIDLSYMHTIITHAAAVHGIAVDTENLRLARTALTRLGLIGRANERDRRPSDDEIDELLAYFDNKTNMIIPMGRVIRFAVATAMRLEEIFTIEWSDVDLKKKVIIIRDRDADDIHCPHWHFDLANTGQSGPITRLQYGGYKHKSDSSLNIRIKEPRWFIPPLDCILLSETVAANFFFYEWDKGLRRHPRWNKLIRTSQKLCYPYFLNTLQTCLVASDSGPLLHSSWNDQQHRS